MGSKADNRKSTKAAPAAAESSHQKTRDEDVSTSTPRRAVTRDHPGKPGTKDTTLKAGGKDRLPKAGTKGSASKAGTKYAPPAADAKDALPEAATKVPRTKAVSKEAESEAGLKRAPRQSSTKSGIASGKASKTAAPPPAIEEDEPYVSTLPEFENDEELLRYFGIELGKAEEPEDTVFAPPAEPDESLSSKDNAEILNFAPGEDPGEPEEPEEQEIPQEPEALSAESDPIEELARLLATAEEAEAVKLNFEVLHTLRDEDIAIKEVEVIRLSDIAFAQIEDAVVDLQEEAHAVVTGKSQAFFHDRSSGKINGEEVYAFVYDHATVESVGSRVIAAGRAVVYADGGWIGAKDEAIVYAKGDAKVQANGDAIIVAEGTTMIEAFGTASVLVNSPQVKVRLISEDACVILMDLQSPIPEIETLDRSPPKVHQLVSIDSPLGLEKMMELSFREAQRRERLSWDYS